MATYCTARDVRIALTPGGVDVGQPTGETGASLEDWQILDAIDEAEGHINAYLANRYIIETEEVEEVNPSDPGDIWIYFVAPVPVRAWTRNIAAYLCALTYRKNKDLGEDDPIRLRYTMTMANLIAVRDHQMHLDLPASEGEGSNPYAENLYDGKLFGLNDFGLGPSDSYAMPQYIWPYRDERTVGGFYG